ncbi:MULTISPECIES: GNAT family N-acetyltransferase [unclassified Fusibacter]|uniref:GNAT family N-acetyltransferase n=1 Tax=unclassified Fusibacter TaxID=2624464 RepID=UPI0013E93964|nr:MULTISPECIES: GNAT family protein [unclassified Fusibacter]MCK8061594.1 GNAT family N-acetyltransferase [Fusibacter sp. A2]NPE23777.1 GNAT family N-acetyltransferase [Fusibacter sp. A1]
MDWKTDLVSLRAVRSSDFLEYFNNGEAIDTEAQRSGDRMKSPIGEDMVKKRVEDLSNQIPGEEDNFYIIEDIFLNPVGNINTHSCSRTDGTFEYGLGIRKKHRGLGYASDAVRLVLDFYFNELNYQKCNVKIYSYNTESINLHLKLGFVEEGRIRRSFFGKGAYHDIICMGLLREEFERIILKSFE